MAEWVLQSVRPTGDRLVVKLAPGTDAEWIVTLDAPGLHAEHRIWERYSRNYLNLDEFFAELNESWRGWDGEKVWGSQGLTLVAQHDRLGHVRIEATLDDAQRKGRGEAWTASLRLFVDAGNLGEIARSARALGPA